jgi:hypothetical protein
MTTKVSRSNDVERCLRVVVDELHRVTSSASVRERLAMKFGMRITHAEEALAADEPDRAMHHLNAALKIGRQLAPG